MKLVGVGLPVEGSYTNHEANGIPVYSFRSDFMCKVVTTTYMATYHPYYYANLDTCVGVNSGDSNRPVV